MTSWTEGPLLGFDLETTGTDPNTARIVQFGFSEWHRGGELISTTQYPVDPGIPIPPEASAVHGITDEHVAEAMVHDAAVGLIVARLELARKDGWPVVVMNGAFDLTIVQRHRLPEGSFVGSIGNVLDVLVLDKAYDQYRRGSRTLTAIAAHYGVPEFEAHGAGADAEATVAVLLLMARKYPGLRESDPERLQAAQRLWKRRQAIGFNDYRRSKGQPPLGPEAGDWPIQRVPPTVRQVMCPTCGGTGSVAEPAPREEPSDCDEDEAAQDERDHVKSGEGQGAV